MPLNFIAIPPGNKFLYLLVEKSIVVDRVSVVHIKYRETAKLSTKDIVLYKTIKKDLG